MCSRPSAGGVAGAATEGGRAVPALLVVRVSDMGGLLRATIISAAARCSQGAAEPDRQSRFSYRPPGGAASIRGVAKGVTMRIIERVPAVLLALALLSFGARPGFSAEKDTTLKATAPLDVKVVPAPQPQ